VVSVQQDNLTETEASWRPAARRLVFPLAVTLAGVLLFACYLRMSLTMAPTSDGASNALQAWDMLHGNLLLHGWSLSDVSFYTTELPEYVLVELIFGLSAHVVNIGGALTYTVLVVSAALLAKGKATGAEGYLRMSLAAGIMLSPQLVSGVSVLILQPDHVGTTVPVLLTWLIIDRAGPRRWVPFAVGLMLAWALAADAIVLYIAIAPLLAVSLIRAYRVIVQERGEISAARPELSLAAAAVAAAAIGLAVPSVIHLLAGYHVHEAPNYFTSGTQLPATASLTLHGLLLLFGANFYRLSFSFATGLVLLHVVGLALAIWAFCSGLRRFLKVDDLVVQLLVAGTLIIITAYVFGQKAEGIISIREIAAALPFGAVLAGRLLAGRLLSARLVPVLAVVAVGYAVTLAVNLVPGPAPAANGELTGWLAGHGYRYGLGDYWLANSATLASEDEVRIRAVTTGPSHLIPYDWESESTWYDPWRNSASFVALASVPRKEENLPWLSQMTRTFGPPAHVYHVGKYLVLVWNYNLLSRL